MKRNGHLKGNSSLLASGSQCFSVSGPATDTRAAILLNQAGVVLSAAGALIFTSLRSGQRLMERCRKTGADAGAGQ